MNNKTFFVKIQYCIRQVGDLNFGTDAIILVNKINTTKKGQNICHAIKAELWQSSFYNYYNI